MAKSNSRRPSLTLASLSAGLDVNLHSRTEKDKQGLYFALRREIVQQMKSKRSGMIARGDEQAWKELEQLCTDQFYEQLGAWNPETKTIDYLYSYEEMLGLAEEIFGTDNIDSILGIDAMRNAEIKRKMAVKESRRTGYTTDF